MAMKFLLFEMILYLNKKLMNKILWSEFSVLDQFDLSF